MRKSEAIENMIQRATWMGLCDRGRLNRGYPNPGDVVNHMIQYNPDFKEAIADLKAGDFPTPHPHTASCGKSADEAWIVESQIKPLFLKFDRKLGVG